MNKPIPSQVKTIQEHRKVKIDKETDNHISYSQFLSFQTCPHQWYLTYVKKLGVYQPSINTVFGTALHETVQTWLEVMYKQTIKESMEMDLNSLLEQTMVKTYKKEKVLAGKHFTTPDQLQSFHEDGIQILEYLKKKRAEYFDCRSTHLVGIEVPILTEISSNLYFKGFIDLVFYDERLDEYRIIDIKTSTSGWNDQAKKDDKKLSQLILYKQFFAKQFNVEIEKIKVEYFIVKRKVPADPEFPSMGKRVQQFAPAAGKIKRAQVTKTFDLFLNEAFNSLGKYQEKDYLKNASKSNCRFCNFKDNKYLCNQAVL